MSHQAKGMSRRIAALVEGRKPGFTLEGDFFSDQEIYLLDVDKIWRRSWLFTGHTCQIPHPGDYFLYEVGADSIIVIRDDDGRIHGLHNVCRHRGTLLCSQESGRAGRLVCPYHQWVYGRDGRLLSCRGMQEELDKSQWGLKKVHLEELEGLIFICLAEEPPDFGEARSCLSPLLKPQGFRRAKVARIIDYDIRANWKVVWENNRECYHCNINHPQYIKANFDHYNADDSTEDILQGMVAETERSERKWASCGLAVTHKQTGMTVFPEHQWFSANRTPLVSGYVSESMDGRQVAPLMGEYTDPDVGTLRIRALPNFWNHSSCDHGVTTRLTAAGPQLTKARVIWVVDEKAVEGKDYRLAELLPFWKLTSEQDWELCQYAQRGICSSAYSPGPYSTYKEYNVEGFVRWYLKQLI